MLAYAGPHPHFPAMRPLPVLLIVLSTACATRGPLPPEPAGVETGVLGRSDDGLLERPELQRLVELQTGRFAEPLRTALGSDDPDVRARAAFALGSVQDTASASALVALLDDPYPRVRADAAFALGQAPGPDAVERLLARARLEPDGGPYAEIVEALGKIGGVHAGDALLALTPPPALAARHTLALARVALGGAAGPPIVDALLARLSDPDPEVRMMAAYWFGRNRDATPWRGQSDRVREALDGAEPTVAMHLALALGRLADPVDDARLTGLAANATDWRVRTNAARALAARAGEDRVAEALWRALVDPVTHVALAAAQAIAGGPRAAADVARMEAWIAANPGRTLVAETLIPPPREASEPRPERAEPDGPPALDWRELRALGAYPRLRLETNRGAITLQLDATQAPLTVQTITRFAEAGMYDGVPFHRVVPNFVIQGGDFDRRDGSGEPGFRIRSELTRTPYRRGILGMARSGKDTEGSQFFITHAMQPHLDAAYTVFGHVVDGLEVVDRIEQGDRVTRARIVR